MKPSIYQRGGQGNWVLVGIAVLLLLGGCSKGGPDSKVQSRAFDAAAADVKQLWTEGMTAWKAHHYSEAATALVTLRGKATQLSPEQSEALSRAIDELGTEAFAAADKGDAGAVEAVKAINAGRPRGSGTP